MALLSWSPQYLIGHPVIDDEHVELFRLINAFHDQWSERQDRQAIAQVLNQLVAYAQMHFKHEENIMLDSDYPALAQHMQIHERMLETIFRLRQSFEDEHKHLEIDTMKFVKAWLLEHILENDYPFRDFLRQRSAAASHAAPPTAS